ncbi:unnamed protein product [Durusdinium trenchii]|uniref:Uncharacterized protein n=1 Tax=Durusdinium trenchii TaxID=1381693 RepID=A0ABP0ME96_9DINO
MHDTLDTGCQIMVGPMLEAVLSACHSSTFGALRAASTHQRTLADQLERSEMPKWPLLLLITFDSFVTRHRQDMHPEFVLEFDCSSSCRAFSGANAEDGARIEVPQTTAEDFVRRLGSMHRALGRESLLWGLPKLRRRATLHCEMTKEVAMQCDPRASRQMVLVDADKQVVFCHTFLDPDYPMPTPGRGAQGAFRKVNEKGVARDLHHCWLLRRLRKLRGHSNIMDERFNFMHAHALLKKHEWIFDDAFDHSNQPLRTLPD